jgi:hypothetical protein
MPRLFSKCSISLFNPPNPAAAAKEPPSNAYEGKRNAIHLHQTTVFLSTPVRVFAQTVEWFPISEIRYAGLKRAG